MNQIRFHIQVFKHMQAERGREHYSENTNRFQNCLCFFLILQLKNDKSKYSFILDTTYVLV